MKPPYFYRFDAPITLDGFHNHRERWFDKWGHINTEEQEEAMPRREKILRGRRDNHYRRYIARFNVRTRLMKWQVIRVLSYQHGTSTRQDWFREYQDCLFRVFVNPHTIYDSTKKKYLQFYILCPEDAFLVDCQERADKGLSYPPRSSFVYTPQHKAFRKLKIIPVECCHHFRHETTAGKLPGEL